MYIDPMLLDGASEPFDSEDHIAELKIDGIRGIINSQDRVRMYTRHKNEMTSRYEELAAAAGAAIGRGSIIDGELVSRENRTSKRRWPGFIVLVVRKKHPGYASWPSTYWLIKGKILLRCR